MRKENSNKKRKNEKKKKKQNKIKRTKRKEKKKRKLKMKKYERNEKRRKGENVSTSNGSPGSASWALTDKGLRQPGACLYRSGGDPSQGAL